MSKWGFVNKSTALRKMRHSREETAEIIEDMSMFILDQEKRINELQNNVIAIQARSSAVHEAQARLLGYQERVRELDPPRKEQLHNYAREPIMDRFKEG